MRRTLLLAWAAVLTVPVCGCYSGPLLDNPIVMQPDPDITVENPVYIPGNPPAYNPIFEKAVEIVSDYFDISYSNRFDGRIETFPRIAPGLEQPCKAGSPDFDQRLLATLQTIRYRAIVLMQAAENGGYFIDVKVFREEEDLPRPTAARSGVATFQGDISINPQAIVVNEATPEGNWIPLGRETKLEQVILQRLRKAPIEQPR
jgi:hypothetical protein